MGVMLMQDPTRNRLQILLPCVLVAIVERARLKRCNCRTRLTLHLIPMRGGVIECHEEFLRAQGLAPLPLKSSWNDPRRLAGCGKTSCTSWLYPTTSKPLTEARENLHEHRNRQASRRRSQAHETCDILGRPNSKRSVSAIGVSSSATRRYPNKRCPISKRCDEFDL